MNFGINIPQYEVSQFNKILKNLVENNFDYIKIRGEISELKNASSGHTYITLKDDSSVLNATLWSHKRNNLLIEPEVGMEVIVTGKISTYAKSISTYSINIDNLELAGEGALLKIIEDRKKNLEKKGIFDQNKKKTIPYLPKKIGVITSPTGSVIYDIINRIKDRFPTNIDLWPVKVQGKGSAEDLIQAIKGFNSSNYYLKPDIIIIARGGGSTEDLMAFNDEKLALAVFESVIPIISAIGHETDTTIIDYVSDLRASTPTAAAEKAVPMRDELEESIMNFSKRLNLFIDNKFNSSKIQIINISKLLKSPKFIIDTFKEKFFNINLNLFKELQNTYKKNNNKFLNTIKILRPPEKILEYNNQYLFNLSKNLNKNINHNLISKINTLKNNIRLLHSNSLHSNLQKGYVVLKKSKKIINKSNLINEKDTLSVQFSDKSIDIEIKKIN